MAGGATLVTLQPVLPPIVLALLAAIVLTARVIALRRLAPAARTRVVPWRWCGMTLAMALLFVAGARPVLLPTEHGASRVADREAPNVFVVLDRSPEMQVQDYPNGESRMSVARDDVAALINRYPGARVAVLSFAAQPVLEWPLSADTWSLRPVVSTIEASATPPGGAPQVNAGAAGNMLRYQLISATQQYPLAKTLVFYLGSGAAQSQQPPRDFNLPEGTVDGGAVLGYGTAAGGPISGTDVARSAIDEPVLRGVAQQIGVPYVPRTDAESLASAAPIDGALSATAIDSAAAASGQTELYWVPALLSAALIVLELYVMLREVRRTRPVNTDVTA
jgi:Ca-activated chloride channel family protein